MAAIDSINLARFQHLRDAFHDGAERHPRLRARVITGGPATTLYDEEPAPAVPMEPQAAVAAVLDALKKPRPQPAVRTDSRPLWSPAGPCQGEAEFRQLATEAGQLVATLPPKYTDSLGIDQSDPELRWIDVVISFTGGKIDHARLAFEGCAIDDEIVAEVPGIYRRSARAVELLLGITFDPEMNKSWTAHEMDRHVGLVAPASGDKNGEAWLTVTQAEDTTGMNRGSISRAAGHGDIESTGTGRERRIGQSSLLRWANTTRKKQRIRGEAKREFRSETDAEVEAKFRDSADQ